MKRTAEQNLERADMADARVLGQILWYSVRGPGVPMPQVSRLPAFDAMREGLAESEHEEEAERRVKTATARKR